VIIICFNVLVSFQTAIKKAARLNKAISGKKYSLDQFREEINVAEAAASTDYEHGGRGKRKKRDKSVFSPPPPQSKKSDSIAAPRPPSSEDEEVNRFIRVF
jgi:hypothetical protein